ncbi:MAG: hypothetical protein J6U11_03400, partial [Campylobacter sp.]|nr:hypothetical protein [Campylobacter sp.]
NNQILIAINLQKPNSEFNYWRLPRLLRSLAMTMERFVNLTIGDCFVSDDTRNDNGKRICFKCHCGVLVLTYRQKFYETTFISIFSPFASI